MRRKFVGRLVAHAERWKVNATHDDPLAERGPHKVPATLGVKIMVGKQQYGAWLDTDGLERMGITLKKGRAIQFDLVLLTEGSYPPPPAEVPDANPA